MIANPALAAEPVEFRHRNPESRRLVVVSEAIFLGYPSLSDGARVTYCVVYSHDWSTAQMGERKGYVYPTIGRLGWLRRKSDRTIQRHLAELIEAGLLSREVRVGEASILYIEEPSAEEGGQRTEASGEGDTFDTPAKNDAPRTSKGKKYISNKNNKTVGNGNHDLLEKDESHIAFLVDEILKVCGDIWSTSYYRGVARSLPDELIFQALSEIKHDGPVRNPGAVFVSKTRPHLPTAAEKEKRG